jgi:hypothetical protein
MNCPICNGIIQHGVCVHILDDKYHVIYSVDLIDIDKKGRTTIALYMPIPVVLNLDGLVFLTAERIEKLLLLS